MLRLSRHQRATYWYSKALLHGDGFAELRMANIYAKGLGVPQDFKKSSRNISPG
jgi:TPR repeat protein